MNVNSGWLAVPGLAKVLHESNYKYKKYKFVREPEKEHNGTVMEKPKASTDIAIPEHLQLSVLAIVLRLLGVIFLLDTSMAFVILGFYALNNEPGWHNGYIAFLVFAHIAKYFLITVVVIRLFADWAGRNYYVRGHHLIEKLGLVNITETTHELSQVKSVIVNQSWLGRRFNYGTIKLNFAGSAPIERVVLCNITNPVRYKKYFDQHMQVQGWVR